MNEPESIESMVQRWIDSGAAGRVIDLAQNLDAACRLYAQRATEIRDRLNVIDATAANLHVTLHPDQHVTLIRQQVEEIRELMRLA